MRLSYFIALRYLFSKKTHHVINIISWVSVSGITLGTMALIIVLSVFNGFESVVVGLFNAYNPELVVEPSRGKTIHIGDFPLDEVRNHKEIEYASLTLQENTLFRYGQNQVVAAVKGVDEFYLPMNRLDTMVIDGDFVLKGENRDYGVFGAGIAYRMGINLNDYFDPVMLYYPNRFRQTLSAAAPGSFNTAALFPAGVFSVQQEFDEKIVFTNLEFARELFSSDSLFSALEIGLKKGASVTIVQKELEQILGGNYRVKNRFQQQELLYKVLRSEKLVVFLILTFILLIAVFNVVGSLTMLILDKKKDIRILSSMSADRSLIRKVFLNQGMIISLSGALAGMLLGLIVGLVQMRFGLLKLPDAELSVIDYYPVVMKISDFIIVFLTIAIIGFLATWIPVNRIKAELNRDINE